MSDINTLVTYCICYKKINRLLCVLYNKFNKKQGVQHMSTEINNQVESLSDLLKILSKEEFRDNKFYFRGESASYEERASSAYRKGVQFSPYSILSVLNQFKRQVGIELTSAEQENFLAYAQHHGVMTNLIDITKSILTAAFFASEENDQSDKGYIYCFDKSQSLYFPSDAIPQDSLQLFNGLLDLNHNTIENLIKMFSEYYYDLYRFVEFYEITLKNLKEVSFSDFDWFWNEIDKEFSVFQESKEDAVKQYGMEEMIPEIENKLITTLRRVSEKINQVIANYSKYQDVPRVISDVGRNLNLRWIINDPIPIVKSLLCVFYMTLESQSGYGTTYIYDLPNIIYESSFNFGRIKEQQGPFIFQDCYREYRGTSSELIKYHHQKIIHDQMIVISDKKKVREELEMLGINEASIYGDPDSIAREIMRHLRHD